MAIQNYVLSKYMSGTSKDDIQLDVTQLIEHRSYAIKNPKSLIAYDIFAALENIIDPQYSEGTIYNLLNTDGKYKLQVFTGIGSNNITSVIICVDNQHSKYYYDVRGGFISRQVYYVSQIEDSNVRYLVSEHIVSPEKGISLIERCYHPIFQDRFKAEKYQSLKMSKYAAAHGTSASGYRLFVVDMDVIQKSQWYNDNMEIARQIKEYNLNVEDYRYIPSISGIFMAIKADAYDDISSEDRVKINKDIYLALRNYVPDEELPFLDEDADSTDEHTIESVADQTIILSLANAESEAAFHKIHEILGPNDYRVGALTDEIYNTHPDEGFILASHNGELQWYKECYSIGMWDGAKNNPYYGKFQTNENDVLLSFREFHPELYVDSFPDQNMIAAWEHKYLETTSELRAKHLELKYDKDAGGEEIVIGDWYYAGLFSKKVITGISFHRTYGSYTFSQDECCKLLSGEELTVFNFITKMEMETTIHGKLKDCSGLYDDEMNVEFVRTDINISKKRRDMNIEFGIEEFGLPPLEGSNNAGGI